MAVTGRTEGIAALQRNRRDSRVRDGQGEEESAKVNGDGTHGQVAPIRFQGGDLVASLGILSCLFETSSVGIKIFSTDFLS